jgi:hypothetical protein
LWNYPRHVAVIVQEPILREIIAFGLPAVQSDIYVLHLHGVSCIVPTQSNVPICHEIHESPIFA